jgi:hypothetical protein
MKAADIIESLSNAESRTIERYFTILSRHIVPLFVNDSRGQPKPYGSSFLVSFDDASLFPLRMS